MKSLGDFKDLTIPLASGVLDGRSAEGEMPENDFRVLLNVDTQDEDARARFPGWPAWRSASPSNEDLHDQLLGGAGKMVDGVFVAYSGQREAILALYEARQSSGVYYSIACTKSRIYASTGQCRNWRIIADNLAGGFSNGDSPWPNVTARLTQVGDYLLFTNNIDPVLVWPLGGAVISEGPNADRRWAMFEIYDLLGLDITRAGVVAEWNGFAFIGNTVDSGTRHPGRVYWSDSAAPLTWAPGGESLAGFVDLGNGETVLRIEPIGGQLRVYTDRAIYSVSLVGGDAVFQFQEIYRGDLAIAFAASFVNAGEAHLWMVQDSIVSLGTYDRVPNRYEWIHRAAGFIFRGLDGQVLNGCPVEFAGFSAMDRSKCYQIAAGYDEQLGNVWFSWPTTDADPSDFEGTRRLTMVINPRYSKATLIDNGFSAFSGMRQHLWKTVRDFMVENGVCSSANIASDANLIAAKEGAPLNELEAPQTPPTCIWNHTEDPTLPKSDDSVAALDCGIKLALDCNKCVPVEYFALASVTDFSIKQFDISARLREVYVPQENPTWIPSSTPQFPNVVQAAYNESGYPTLIQGAIGKWETSSEKIVTRVKVDYDAETQTIPGRLFCQIGVSSSPKCVQWKDADPITLDCLQGGLDQNTERSLQPAMFQFYRAGQWVAYRLFVATGDGELNYAPTGCGVTVNQVQIRMKQKSETFANQ